MASAPPRWTWPSACRRPLVLDDVVAPGMTARWIEDHPDKATFGLGKGQVGKSRASAIRYVAEAFNVFIRSTTPLEEPRLRSSEPMEAV